MIAARYIAKCVSVKRLCSASDEVNECGINVKNVGIK